MREHLDPLKRGKKKILFLTDTLTGGGAEKALMTLVATMDKEKYDITVMTLFNLGPYKQVIGSLGITYRYVFSAGDDSNDVIKGKSLKSILLDFAYLWFWKLLPAGLFYRMFIRGRFDTEVAFLEGKTPKIIAASPNRKSKKVAFIHTDLIENPRASRFFLTFAGEKRCWRRFDSIACVSGQAKDAFVKKYGITRNVVVRYNIIDAEDVLRRGSLPPEGFVRPRGVVLCAAGRMVPQKGFDQLLRVFCRLVNEGLDVSLILLGSGACLAQLRDYVMENGLEGRAFLPGFAPNPYGYMAMSDIFVSSSLAEGFGLVIAEAMILGLPVVSTDCIGPREILDGGKYGVLAPEGEEGLFHALRSMAESPQMRAEYAEKSLNRAKSFHKQKALQEIEELF